MISVLALNSLGYIFMLDLGFWVINFACLVVVMLYDICVLEMHARVFI